MRGAFKQCTIDEKVQNPNQIGEIISNANAFDFKHVTSLPRNGFIRKTKSRNPDAERRPSRPGEARVARES